MYKIAAQLANFFNKVAQNLTSKELLKMTDIRLADIGLSRLKLERGAAGYPWRVEKNAVILKFAPKHKVTPVIVAMKQEIKIAAYSSR
ncbi:MAG: hypothetical protein ACJATV_000265 [Granulosicoccus sp.]|jgi:uncharacterized protein YjiS (DUF1127 family)